MQEKNQYLAGSPSKKKARATVIFRLIPAEGMTGNIMKAFYRKNRFTKKSGAKSEKSG